MFKRLWLILFLVPLHMQAVEELATKVILVDETPITIFDREERDPIPSFSFDSVAIPMRRAGNLMLMEAVIEGERGFFILDLGAPYLVLNQTYFRDFQTESEEIMVSLTDVGSEVRRTDVKDFGFAGISYERVTADVTDLSAIEDKRGVKVLGLLGVNLFKEFTLDLDVLAQQMVLYPEGISPGIQKEAEISADFKLSRNVVFMDMEVGGKKLRVSLDTGAEFNVLHSGVPKKVLKDMKILQSFNVTGSDSRTAQVIVARIPGMRIEEHELRPMRTMIYDMSALREAYGLGVQGMLGYPFLSQGRIILDFPNKSFRFYSG